MFFEIMKSMSLFYKLKAITHVASLNIFKRQISSHQLSRDWAMFYVVDRIQANAFSEGFPCNDLLISDNQKMMAMRQSRRLSKFDECVTASMHYTVLVGQKYPIISKIMTYLAPLFKYSAVPLANELTLSGCSRCKLGRKPHEKIGAMK